jgi:2-(1,2-epoxy-1,2-dihydrophenyl)acetyl-CoA isomerase
MPAAGSAKFAMTYAKVGLNPDGVATYFLPRLLGIRRVIELAYLNACSVGGKRLNGG